MKRTYTIPLGMTYVDEFSIENHEYWEEVIIPDTVTSIETRSFAYVKMAFLICVLCHSYRPYKEHIHARTPSLHRSILALAYR